MNDQKPKLGSDKLSQKAASNEDEKTMADRLGGRRQPNSGATPAHKGDIKLDRFLLDLKTTGTNSFVLSLKDLVTICRHANGEGKHPGLVIQFTGKRPPETETDWVLLPVPVLEKMLQSGQDERLEEE